MEKLPSYSMKFLGAPPLCAAEYREVEHFIIYKIKKKIYDLSGIGLKPSHIVLNTNVVEALELSICHVKRESLRYLFGILLISSNDIEPDIFLLGESLPLL